MSWDRQNIELTIQENEDGWNSMFKVFLIDKSGSPSINQPTGKISDTITKVFKISRAKVGKQISYYLLQPYKSKQYEQPEVNVTYYCLILQNVSKVFNPLFFTLLFILKPEAAHRFSSYLSGLFQWLFFKVDESFF